jgi:hypothetical protein
MVGAAPGDSQARAFSRPGELLVDASIELATLATSRVRREATTSPTFGHPHEETAVRPLPLSIVSLTLTLAGCASPLSVSAMVPEKVEIEHTFDASVSVRAQGSEGSFLSHAILPSEDLQASLVQALSQSKLFRTIGPTAADWELTVSVSKLVEPETGLDMSATVFLDWLLAKSGTGAIAWNETIATSFTATTFDADFMEERQLLAVQGAVRENIEQGLARLSHLDLTTR